MSFSWRAVYTDQSELWQCDPAGQTVNTYADIDRSRLEVFGLYRGDQPVVMVDFRDDANGDAAIGPKRLIWRKRHLKDNRGMDVKVYLIGWQRKVSGRNVQSICFVAENGAVILGGQWRDDEALRGGIVPLPWESDLTE